MLRRLLFTITICLKLCAFLVKCCFCCLSLMFNYVECICKLQMLFHSAYFVVYRDLAYWTFITITALNSQFMFDVRLKLKIDIIDKYELKL